MNAKIDRNAIFCACGCGDVLADRDRYGKIIKYIPSHWRKIMKDGLRKGGKWKNIENHNKWNGGRSMVSGYVMVYAPNHPFKHKNKNYVLEHRLVWEKHNNAILLPWAIVHHINGIKTDNRIENLQVFNRSSHALHHVNDNRNKGRVMFYQIRYQ